MTGINFQTDYIFKKTLVFLCAALFICLGGLCAAGQSQNETSVSEVKESDQIKTSGDQVKTENEKTALPVEARSGIKVVFDDKNPGVLIIESNGERVRVDTTRKTVEPVGTAVKTSDEQAPSAVRPEETAKTENAETQDEDKEESVFDFDEGEEPYDYRLVNIPTPKKVPRGTWNLSFTHRFSQPIHPISESGKNLLGFDSFSISSFNLFYGITDKFYVTANRSPLCQRGLCRTIEVGFGYNWLAQDKDSPVGLTTYASVEGNDNFTEEYTFNLQTMLSARLGKRVYLHFSPAVHLNANGQRRFNPRAEDFFPPAVSAVNAFRLPKHTASFGFGASVMIMHDLVALFDFTPRVGFKLGLVEPVFDNNFRVTGFRNRSQPTIGFGIQKNIGKHSFALTFSNTQTTTTSRYNSSNLVLSPRRLVIGFNLARRF